MITNSRTTLLHLSLISGSGAAVIEKLIAGFSFNRLEMLYRLSATEIMQVARLSEATAEIIVAGLRDVEILDKELSLIEKQSIDWVTLGDAGYPELLKHIHLPPPVLYIRGAQLTDISQPLAVVGSRASDAYGANVIAQLLPPLVTRGYSIISGGALGIDALAHETALKHGGVTLAVLGSGLLKAYPNANKSLFNRIVASGGSVISAFPLNTEPFPGNFPARNRIIAGLATGCLVVQAAAKSGALITASFALENGREVLAVPGPITSALSAGCHNLIAQGATIVTCADDIRRAYGEIIEEKEVAGGKKKVESSGDAAGQTNMTLIAIPRTNLPQNATPQEKILYYVQTALSIDDLLIKMEIDLLGLQSLLLEMQLDGLIEQNNAGCWIKI